MNDCFYFDTSIWIDIYDKRGENGEMAKRLVEKIIQEDSIIIYSDMVMVEFKKVGFSDYEINQILNVAKPDNLKRVHLTKIQAEEAKRLTKQRNIPFGDAMHAILSREHEAQLVSRDEKDFNKLKDITLMKKPEELV